MVRSQGGLICGCAKRATKDKLNAIKQEGKIVYDYITLSGAKLQFQGCVWTGMAVTMMIWTQFMPGQQHIKKRSLTMNKCRTEYIEGKAHSADNKYKVGRRDDFQVEETFN